MTLRNSFWVNSKENHKRRIWVWIVVVLIQLMAYVGILTVYLSRIRMWNSEGSYRTHEEFQKAMYQAAKDALGFQDNLLFAVLIMAAVIGIHGFSYLFDRKKVDMYHSVPVNKNKRFAVIYVNGIIIYLVSVLLSLLIGVVTAAIQGAMNSDVMAVVGLGFLWNFLFFLVMYHIAIFAVMVTGNRFITICVTGGLIGYEYVIYMLCSKMKYAFFETVSGFYITQQPKLSVIYDYSFNIWSFKMAENANAIAREVLPYYGKWFILALVILAAAWLCYVRRPSEAAGKAIAFPRLEPVIKVAVAIPAGVGLGMWVHAAAYYNMLLTAASMVVGGAFVCAFIEVIYDFDIKSCFRHLLSSAIAVAGIVLIFVTFKQDLLGYDRYLPTVDQLDSIALGVDYFGEFWDKDFSYMGYAEFSEEHMFLKDVEPVLTLAEKAQQDKQENMDDPRIVNVLYRLKSGRKVGRCFYVDFSNPANEALMNRIVGTSEFKVGTYQIMTDMESYDQAVGITYSNGAVKVALPVEDIRKLREAYVQDLTKADFTLMNSKRPCGQIRIAMPNWIESRLDVYDSYENTIAYLQSRDAFYPVELDLDAIADITVNNFHFELDDDDSTQVLGVETREAVAVSDYMYDGDHTVTKTFFEKDEIEEIIASIYPASMSSIWNDGRELDENYDLFITFKKDTTYPYDRSNIGVYYKFYTGQVPQFVVEGTAVGAGDE